MERAGLEHRPRNPSMDGRRRDVEKVNGSCVAGQVRGVNDDWVKKLLSSARFIWWAVRSIEATGIAMGAQSRRLTAFTSEIELQRQSALASRGPMSVLFERRLSIVS
jgi:hypothetical protein